ncbi:hypothetical protein MZD04_gp289 [Pseudomonas phage Psa21]|uniref:Uncharacterized protein n=1 Tax=Pseudomonas phage Psa21 TaxID=2530023 RepID=A0A481W5N8_9CAUD|nr:hypothetical protein MZD04_gp289 [Pseudomonas phage Psa21]QBJ02815.1 hypothetical protein PSA21_289 [Pseudomonas phage Psa21]
MALPARWTTSVKATATLYLNGGKPEVVRSIVKDLNVLYNTHLATDKEAGRAVAVLEKLTDCVGGRFDHHRNTNNLTAAKRMQIVEAQLHKARPPY